MLTVTDYEKILTASKPLPKAMTGYSLQETWELLLKAIKRKDVESIETWQNEYLAKGGWENAADVAIRTNGRNAPSKAIRRD